MRLIDGRAIAAGITARVAAGVAALGRAPVLAVVVPTADEATAWYVRSIERAAGRVRIECRVVRPAPGDLRSTLAALSAEPAVDGVMCQAPLPSGVTLADAGALIDPAKDVDGANPTSLGRLAAGLPCFAPATAAAVLEILRHERVPLAGARAVVVGRSTVVGKPAALLLLAEHATVTVCHSRTADLAAECARARVLVAAVGRAHLLGADHIAPGATVIDVGTNPGPDGALLGDVDPSGADHAAALTPVPGGVGPVTTALLLRHTLAAAGH
ncbi:bifunctional 5,10-methylenetetrahydrofolate dehydrogenase/5,10-methenyltetrahydrofolate cyclohydrolase [Rhizomonospora bruguierae]|uniref:bifunctional 5,10-methylenetetrahydrofolate dehydrogenase/5,10-methenyltetrahydrofolate cyclohydrolase n=1 Tax=Rhizomonospora bruguierae TaxID=1581705 RepID=UPI001BD1959A|nr:bifunctional 5,10-methylenetetrahydrofolate dehydrogenase/5,10-methenyltetrahydrofolate cyclohydrolase [Micromonospora sp. NBRC 107566]